MLLPLNPNERAHMMAQGLSLANADERKRADEIIKEAADRFKVDKLRRLQFMATVRVQARRDGAALVAEIDIPPEANPVIRLPSTKRHEPIEVAAEWQFNPASPWGEYVRGEYDRVVAEERAAVEREAQAKANLERAAAETHERARVTSWRTLTAARRALVRLGGKFTSEAFASTLADEERGTLPPDGWTAPVVDAPKVEAAPVIAPAAPAKVPVVAPHAPAVDVRQLRRNPGKSEGYTAE